MIRFFRDPVRCMRHLKANYGDVAAVTGGDPSLVCAFGPELNRQVLTDRNTFRSELVLPVRILNDSPLQRLTTFLAAKNGESHHNLRRALLPLFHRSRLEHYRDDVVAATEQTVSTWRNGDSIDLSSATGELALTVAFRCLFGVDVRTEAAFLAQLSLGFTSSATAIRNVLLPFEVPGLPYWRFMRACDRHESLLLEMIRERRSKSRQGTDVLSILTDIRDDDGRHLPEFTVVGLVNEFFIAGHDSTARTLFWTLLLLERHPWVLDELREELTKELSGNAPALDDLDRLPCLDAVVKESMRLMPALPVLFPRKVARSVRLGNYDLPPEAKVVISPLMTHHMPELYTEPRRFRPERWRTGKPTAYEYMPFGGGTRSCLGEMFAGMTLRLSLSVILQRHRFTVEPGSRVSYRVRGVILGTKGAVPARVHAVDHDPEGVVPIHGNLGDLVDLP